MEFDVRHLTNSQDLERRLELVRAETGSGSPSTLSTMARQIETSKLPVCYASFHETQHKTPVEIMLRFRAATLTLGLLPACP